MNGDDWLEDTLAPSGRLAETTLVLCRTANTASRVRRWVARREGLPAIDVVTPRSLALQAWMPALFAEAPGESADLPADNPMAQRIGGRPGLTALARRHAHALQLRRLALDDATSIGDSSVPDWLIGLADAGVGEDDEVRSLRWLLERARSRGADLSVSHTFKRVVCLGFDLPEGALSPWESALAEALTGEPPEPVEIEPAPLPCRFVPDVAAAARVAIREALLDADPDESMVLVSDDATAERMATMLRRNGIPCTWQGTGALDAHTLASALRRMSAWFSGEPDPLIRNVDIDFVLGHRLIARDLPAPGRRWLDHELGAGTDPWLGRRALARTLNRARLLEAPLSRWLAVLEHHPGDADQHSDRLRLAARLRALSAAVRGEAFESAYGLEAEAGEWSEFDELVRDLLGDDAFSADLPDPGTLGALRRFLLSLRVITRRPATVVADPNQPPDAELLTLDVASLALLGALRDRAEWPCSSAHVRLVLSGGVDPRELSEGVEICRYDDYDGRRCHSLVLLDVHNKGLSRRPTPDPFLSEDELHELGLRGGRALVDQRLASVWLAAARARRVLAVVTEKDAGGRDVVPPVQLELEPVHEQHRPPSYGIRLGGLPESAGLDVLRTMSGRLPPLPPPGNDHQLDLARQCTAEWMRTGRALPQRLPGTTQPIPRGSSLAEHLEQAPIPPPWLAPYIGSIPGVSEGTLPSDKAWSNSRLFQPLSHCLYQAFAKVVLRVREPETISEDLDPKEIGLAVHAAFEHATPWLDRRPPPKEEEAVRAEVLRHLTDATHKAFTEQRQAFGPMSAARERSAGGQEDRWIAHWPGWAERRIGSVSRAASRQIIRDFLDSHPAAWEVVDALVDAAGDLPHNRWRLKTWALWAAGQMARGNDLSSLDTPVLLCRDDRRAELDFAWEPACRQIGRHPSLQRLARASHQAEVHATAVWRAITAQIPELTFGPDAGPAPVCADGEVQGEINGGEVEFPLGRGTVSIRGAIDRLAIIDGPEGPLLEIVDYKTTGHPPANRHTMRREILALKTPQLLLYALAVRELTRRGDAPELLEGAEVALVGFDHVRHTISPTRQAVGAHDPVLVDDEVLDLAATRLGKLLDRGRDGQWLLHPRSDTCPRLTSWGHDYCPYASACRLGSLPPPEEDA